jgi:hypothetical protein
MQRGLRLKKSSHQACHLVKTRPHHGRVTRVFAFWALNVHKLKQRALDVDGSLQDDRLGGSSIKKSVQIRQIRCIRVPIPS